MGWKNSIKSFQKQLIKNYDIAETKAAGSSLKGCLVASGQADIYYRFGYTMEWDTAAGDAILRSAGGTVVTLDGRTLRYGKTETAGMRPFENPAFVAVGDESLLERALPGAAA